MKEIKLKHGEIVLIDDEDYEELSRYSWCLNSAGYASRRISRNKSLFMHRFINKTLKGFETDHINGNKLDNRKENLRNVTHSRNQMHDRIPSNNTSGVKGVYFDKTRRKWLPRVKVNGKNIYLGIFSDLEEAKIARKQGEELYFYGHIN